MISSDVISIVVHGWLVSYAERLERLKSETGSTLALWGDEFGDDGDMLSLQENGFIDPSSAFDSITFTDNDRHAVGDGRSDFGKGDSTEPVGGEGEGVNRASLGQKKEEEEKGAAEAEAEASGTVDGPNIVGDEAPKPRPMNIDEPEWDMEGDYMPLPAWKVS